ncbi:MAG: HAMP domain-containing histidine kinase [Betaproteobacteria bacterium]|nr:HAMP domain-containing histidine kinase [Betaproteobacteria bacterium]
MPASGPLEVVPPPQPASPVGTLRGLTLRAKAVLLFVAFGAFIAFTLISVGQQRGRLIAIAEDLERLHVVESTLARVSAASAAAVLKINDDGAFAEPREVAQSVAIEIESLGPGLRVLGELFPGGPQLAARLEDRLARARTTSSRADLIDLRSEVNVLVARLGQSAVELRARKDRLWEGYRAKYDEITLSLVAMTGAGLVFFGALTVVFFTRLAGDLRRLGDQAIDVVRGRREPIPVTRGDEVGRLMDSVNRMQEILREREGALEVTRQQRFHQEKMAAVGSLAAAVAHEINNPIAAIQGVAESIRGNCENSRCGNLGNHCHPDMILTHTKRIAQITRQLADLTSARSVEAEWVDLNSLLRSTASFVSFDRRLRHARLDLDLDPAVPAVWSVPDHITQVAMNLVLNAADAISEVAGGEGRVAIATRPNGGFVRVEVSDNGAGMEPEVLARAFEEAFTTKPAGRGSGIGLFMCKTLIERAGGRIAIASRAGEGTRVEVDLPTREP